MGNAEFCSHCGARQNGGAARRRLTLSSGDKKLAGVCGGLAEYFGVDATLLRVVWAILTLVTGLVFGAVAYLVAWVLMPAAPSAAGAVTAPGTPATGAGSI